jgi:hypothetical protein
MRGHDNLPALLNPLRSVPQIEINQHATHGHVYPTHSSYSHRLLVLVSKSEDLVSNLLNRNDTRSPDADLFLGPVFEVVSRFEESEEGRRVGEDFEAVEDLRDAVVCEHGQFVNTSAWDYGVGYLVRK